MHKCIFYDELLAAGIKNPVDTGRSRAERGVIARLGKCRTIASRSKIHAYPSDNRFFQKK